MKIYLTDGKRHLICVPYSIENLHEMARELNIGRQWYHRGKLPHYDIPKRRQTEITSRCELITSKEVVKIIMKGLKDGN